MDQWIWVKPTTLHKYVNVWSEKSRILNFVNILFLLRFVVKLNPIIFLSGKYLYICIYAEGMMSLLQRNGEWGPRKIMII